MKLICLECKIEFDAPNWKTIRPRKFCSLSCSSKHNKHGGDISSLSALTQVYGEIEGKIRYLHHNKKLSERMRGRPGPMLGKRCSDEHKKKTSESVKRSVYHTNIRGVPLPEEKKREISKKLLGVFTLNWFISKYGELDGKTKYQERCDKISSNNALRVYNKTNKNNYSKISQELFWILYNDLSLKDRRIYFAELNHEYGCETNTNFDFVDIDHKKVIEFNGDIWHGNPIIFNETDTPNPYDKNLIAKTIWDSDTNKIKKAKSNGYDVLVVWGSDYKRNKYEVIEKCKEHLSKI